MALYAIAFSVVVFYTLSLFLILPTMLDSDAQLVNQIDVSLSPADKRTTEAVADDLMRRMNVSVAPLSFGGRSLSVIPASTQIMEVRERLAEMGFTVHN